MSSNFTKSGNPTGALAAAALVGIFNGFTSFGGSTAEAASSLASLECSQLRQVTHSLAGTRMILNNNEDPGKHDCKGQNDCRGQGGCSSNENGCRGKNSCKGKGGCNANRDQTK